MTASGMVPSAIAGRIRCERALRKAPWSEASSESTSMKPVTGAMSYWIAMRPDTGVQRLPHVVAVLHRQRPVEPELVKQTLVAFLGHATLARKRLDRIARNEADQREDEQRDAEGDALEDKGEHAAAQP